MNAAQQLRLLAAHHRGLANAYAEAAEAVALIPEAGPFRVALEIELVAEDEETTGDMG